MSKKSHDHTVKIMMIGDSSVGKTLLMNTYTENPNETKLVRSTNGPTVGVDFRLKSLVIEGQQVKLQIWDTAGQERFHAITCGYYRNADAICMVYDVTNPSSFQNIARWLRNVDENARENCLKIIVGNKADQKDLRVVPESHGKELADKFQLPFMETSAMTGYQVREMFESVVRNILAEKLEKMTAINEQTNSWNTPNASSLPFNLTSAFDTIENMYNSSSKTISCCKLA